MPIKLINVLQTSPVKGKLIHLDGKSNKTELSELRRRKILADVLLNFVRSPWSA